ncbi:MAG TPA: glycosyltransferase [Longimicrobiales bacterium]|nr:glycosyltransferase [Longimicrobiales bacterium]
MNVLLSSHGASLFGAERVLLALATGLARRGHTVTLEFPHEGPALDVANGLPGVRTVVSGRARLPRNARGVAHWALHTPASIRAFQRIITESACDVVWVNSMYNLGVALAARASRVPAVWHLHERNFPGAAGLVMRQCVRACSRVAVAPSSFVARSFDGRAAPALRVVPNALLAALEPLPPAADDAFRVGYIGQFEPRKRAPDVVHAVARLPGASAVLVGDGKARATVEQAIAHCNLAGRVGITGFREDIRTALDGCTCIAIPSRNEPFGLVALEAMALGLPVVAADSGALPDVLADAALYYPTGDVAALAACLARLRDDAALRATLRARGLERVRTFTLDRMLDGVESALDDAVGVQRVSA